MVKVVNMIYGNLKNGFLSSSLRIKHNRLESISRVFNHIPHKLYRIALYILLFSIAFVFLYPFLYVFITSLKTYRDINDFTVNWIPRSIKYQNYIFAIRILGYFKYITNSVLLTVIGTLGHLISCSFIGYGFARYKFPGKNILFFIVILSIIVPIQTLIVPLYMAFSNYGWVNTYLPILVPTFFGFGLRGGLFIFIFRQFYTGFPKELEDAAKIDGCGFLRTYWSIVLPVARSVFWVVIVLSMVWHWNDFYEPSIYINKMALTVLPARLQTLVNYVNNPQGDIFFGMLLEEGEDTINNAVLMAGTFLIIFPILMAFGFIQKKFMQGIERTGLVE
ncbi:MAG: carbohydrate ABC transporter permease [Clostridiales bacterium]|nr:carbohydrate ABC transporter permease [Clostridiales bacterium]